MKEGVVLEKALLKGFYMIQRRLRYGDLSPMTGKEYLGIVNGGFVQIGTCWSMPRRSRDGFDAIAA
jgi:hypothetical protein